VSGTRPKSQPHRLNAAGPLKWDPGNSRERRVWDARAQQASRRHFGNRLCVGGRSYWGGWSHRLTEDADLNIIGLQNSKLI